MSEQQNRLLHISWLWILGFAGIAFSLIWVALRADNLLSRNDNPRLVEAEYRIQRGLIVDNQETILAENRGDPNRIERFYPISDIGPAVGYYSLRHGVAGIEQGYDAALRGESQDAAVLFRRAVLHEPQIGQDVRLTINVEWQAMAERLLGEHTGAVLLFSLPEGDVQVMTSHPSYDPNLIDEQFDELIDGQDAPLFNRVTQGQYQPGGMLLPLVSVYAEDKRGELGLDLSLPIETALNALSAERLQQIFLSIGLIDPPLFPIQVDEIEPSPVEDIQRALTGQENLTVSPLQLGMAWGAIANAGISPAPRLVSGIRQGGEEWQIVPAMGADTQLFDPAIAHENYKSLEQSNNVSEIYGLALSGPRNVADAWYIGFAPSQSPQIGIVVLLENVNRVDETVEIGNGLLSSIFFEG